MGRAFIPYDEEQLFLLPPDIRQWLPPGHLALYVNDLVEELDLTAILRVYEEGDNRGRPAYHPVMMTKLLIYGYCVGKMSSRKLEQATTDDVAFRVLSCNQQPDHDSIADFRKRHCKELGNLFIQILRMCQRAGMVKLGHVAVDSSKIRANASKHRSLTYGAMKKAESELEREVVRLLEEAQRIDDEEDKLYGKGRRGDELPEELRQRESRLKKIREIKAELEREAGEAAEKEAKEKRDRLENRERHEKVAKSYRRRQWAIGEDGGVVPKAKVQRNLTDVDSRLMMDTTTRSYQQAYNAHIGVDSQAQIIVAAKVEQAPNDQEQLVPMLVEVKKNVGRLPDAASADAGYFSSAAVTDELISNVDLYVPPNEPEPADKLIKGGETANARQRMWGKLKSDRGREIYNRRSVIVEPVFGQIKHVRGFRQFLLRGIERVEAEWSLICMTHNLMKLFRATLKQQST